MEDQLLDEETIITRSQSDEIILTTHRIRQQFGSTNTMKSIMLDQISCVKAKTDSNPVLLVLGILALIVTPFLLSETERSYGMITCIIGIALALMYYFTRRSIISVYAGVHVIEFHTKGMDEDKVVTFINSVEEARKNLMKF
jgi:hypothetical protein